MGSVPFGERVQDRRIRRQDESERMTRLETLPPALLAVMEADHLIEVSRGAKDLDEADRENVRGYLTKLAKLALDVREEI